jgi:PAS domain S-box-containing protein
MRDEDKSKEQLIAELVRLREQIAQERSAELRASNERLLQEAEDRRSSEEKYKGLLEACPDAVVMTSLQGRILFASRQTAELLGFEDSEELAGQSVFHYVVEEDRERLAANFARLLESGVRRNTEYTALRKDGTTVPTDAASAVIRDANHRARAVMGVIRDISARKLAEQALRESEERAEETRRQSHQQLEAIFNGMLDGLMVLDIETRRFVRVNASICQLLGYSETELLSMSPQDIHPTDELPAVLARLQARIAGQFRGVAESRALRKDGSVVHVEIASNFFLYNGRPCIAGFFRDITERRQSRIALERERRTLKHMLEASDHERQLIAYDIHDGLAQQLAGAIMQFQIYAHTRPTNPKEATKAFDAGTTMLRQGHAEARRIISGVRPPILDEAGVIAAIAHLVHEPAFQGGPKIDFWSRVHFRRLDPVLENVVYRICQEGLTNARKHSKSDKIAVSLVQRGDRLRIEIRDWGGGFNPNAVHGNRFGLEGIRERARILGGKCRIKSRPGEGTRIAVVVPVVERD